MHRNSSVNNTFKRLTMIQVVVRLKHLKRSRSRLVQRKVSPTDKTSPNNTTPKGSFVTTHHGLPNKPKRARKFRCKICDGIFNSTKEWNCHYEATHPLLTCSDCDKTFRNPTSLYRHRYSHTRTENLYPCPQCTAVFTFSSQLSLHMFQHRKVNHFPCSYNGCNKAFKTEWNRRAHKKSY